MQRQKRTGEERGGAGTGCGSEQEAGPVQGLEGQVAWMRTPVLPSVWSQVATSTLAVEWGLGHLVGWPWGPFNSTLGCRSQACAGTDFL